MLDTCAYNDQTSRQVRTFLRGYNIATWWYHVVGSLTIPFDLFNDQKRADWIADTSAHLILSVTNFAEIGYCSVSTYSKGDNAGFAWKHSSGDLLPCLQAFLRNTPDVYYVDFGLNLLCAKKGNQSECISYSDGSLCLWSNINEGKLSEGRSSYAEISFGLENSIYAPTSIGTDNRELAALNGPRLRAFLQRLGSHPDLVLKEVDCDSDYIAWMRKHDLFDDGGFKMPEDNESFELLLKSEAEKAKKK